MFEAHFDSFQPQCCFKDSSGFFVRTRERDFLQNICEMFGTKFLLSSSNLKLYRVDQKKIFFHSETEIFNSIYFSYMIIFTLKYAFKIFNL